MIKKGTRVMVRLQGRTILGIAAQDVSQACLETWFVVEDETGKRVSVLGPALERVICLVP